MPKANTAVRTRTRTSKRRRFGWPTLESERTYGGTVDPAPEQCRAEFVTEDDCKAEGTLDDIRCPLCEGRM